MRVWRSLLRKYVPILAESLTIARPAYVRILAVGMWTVGISRHHADGIVRIGRIHIPRAAAGLGWLRYPVRRHSRRSRQADLHGRKAGRDYSAMNRRISQARCGLSTNEHGEGPRQDRVWRADTSRCVADTGCRLSPDQDSRTTSRQDRTADVRNRRCGWRHHRARVHVADARCGRHVRFLTSSA